MAVDLRHVAVSFTDSYRPRMPLPFRLATDGDDLERRCWPLFVRREFPSYEKFWYVFVAPLTNRVSDRGDVHFKSDAELAAMKPARGFYDLYLGQLNYSVLWHLSAVFDMRVAGATVRWDSQLFVSAILRLSSAHDVADELLQRDSDGKVPADPWGHRALEARRAWRDKHRSPTFLRELQDYRHQLVHSGPFMHWAEGPYFPKVGHHRDYRDWRKATAQLTEAELAKFAHASEIVEEAWDQTVRYLDTSWRALLRRHRRAATRLPPIRRFGSSMGVAEPSSRGDRSARGDRSSTTPTISVGQAVPMDVRIILDALSPSRPVTATTEPVYPMPAADFWSVATPDWSGSSTTPSAPVLSGSMPPKVAISPQIGEPRRPTRRQRAKLARG